MIISSSCFTLSARDNDPDSTPGENVRDELIRGLLWWNICYGYYEVI
jgi:hypothetical protein